MRGKHLTAIEAAREMLSAPNCALYRSALNPSVVSRLIKLGWAGLGVRHRCKCDAVARRPRGRGA